MKIECIPICTFITDSGRLKYNIYFKQTIYMNNNFFHKPGLACGRTKSGFVLGIELGDFFTMSRPEK